MIISTPILLNAIAKPETQEEPIVKSGIAKPGETSTENLCYDILVSLLFVDTQKAVHGFYESYLKEIPGADPNFDKVLSVERLGDQNRNDFIIKVETMPYIGPHNSVGRDHITFRVNAIGEVTLEKYEHI